MKLHFVDRLNLISSAGALSWRCLVGCMFVVFVQLHAQYLLLPAACRSGELEVAVFKDIGVGPSFDSLADVLRAQPNIRMTVLDGNDVAAGSLKGFDIFMVPGGSGRKEANSLGAAGQAEIKRFISEGGCYVGICAGCYLASSAPDFMGLLPLGIRDRQHWFRGKAVLPIEYTPAGMDVFGLNNPEAEITYHNGPILDSRELIQDPQLARSVEPLAFYRGEIVGRGGEPGVMNGAPAMVLGRFGKGFVLGISPHPEQTPPLYKTIPHALYWLRQHVGGASVASAPATQPARAATRPSREARGVSGCREAPSQSEQEPGVLTAATPVAQKAIDLARRVFLSADVVRYMHNHVPAADQVTVDDNGLVARTDCSGFISYLLHTVAPRHYRAVRQCQPSADYPQAKTWARFFGTLSDNQPSQGWLRIARYDELRPGDVIAWAKARKATDHAGGGNTGHVMMVAGLPEKPQRELIDGRPVLYVSVPVIDSSSVYHFPPERLPPNAHQENRNGLGVGNVRIVLSESGDAIGYWEGTYWGEGQKPVEGPKLSPDVRFARMVSLI